MKIKVQGYQAIKEPLELEVEGLTVITGESNIGKSSILRAVIGALTNQKGNDFISKGADKCIVVIENKGHKLTWLKGSKQNEYEFDGEVFRKTGNSTPVEQIAQLGFHELVAQERPFYPQIQRQFALPFILSETSPVAAAELIAASKDGQILAKAIKLAQKDQSTLSSTIDLRDTQITRLSKKLDGTREFEAALLDARLDVEDAQSQYEDTTSKAARIKELSIKWNKQVKVTKALAKIPTTDPANPPEKGKAKVYFRLKAAWFKAQKQKKATQNLPEQPAEWKHQDLRDKAIRLKNLKRKLKKATKVIKALEKLPEDPKPLDLSKDKAKIKRFQELRKRHQEAQTKLSQAIKDLPEVEKDINSTLEAIQKTLFEMGECPTCGSVLETKHACA